MPSMPVALWGDDDGERYRASYFDLYPGVWRQGDWIRFTERGTCVLTGRSDATLNRGGVRLGTGEFYAMVEELPEIADSLVVHLEDAEGGSGELLLFVVAAPGIGDRRAGPRANRIDVAQGALAAPRARRDRRRAGDPAHADRQEARGARSSGSCAAIRPSGSPAATRWPIPRRSTHSSRSRASARPHGLE